MAVFAFDDRHKEPGCNPPRGEIWGELDPGMSGPGSYAVEVVTEDDETIASGTGESEDGSPVGMSMDHGHPGPKANVRVRIDGEFTSNMTVPICLEA